MKKTADPIQFASGYTLDLYCDCDNTLHRWKEFPHQYAGETWGECAKAARRHGWVLHCNTRTATCPKCRIKKK